MFRCYLTFAEHIVFGEDLHAATLEEACEEAIEIAHQNLQFHSDGFEIWSSADHLISGRIDEKWPHAMIKELHHT